MTDTPPPRALGRKTIRPTLRPQELMTDAPDLAGVWTAQVLTLLPDAFPGILGESLLGRALKDGLWQLQVTDLRRFGEGKHRNVDDTPAGGGAGMVLRADVLDKALRDVRSGARGNMPLIYLSPARPPHDAGPDADAVTGRRRHPALRPVRGHRRARDRPFRHDRGVSLGDFVMTGGEIAAMALIDATVRLIPRVLGNQASTVEESFSDGLLEHPQYTRPADLGRPRDTRRSSVRASREDRRLATGTGRKADKGTQT